MKLLERTAVSNAAAKIIASPEKGGKPLNIEAEPAYVGHGRCSIPAVVIAVTSTGTGEVLSEPLFALEPDLDLDRVPI